MKLNPCNIRLNHTSQARETLLIEHLVKTGHFVDVLNFDENPKKTQYNNIDLQILIISDLKAIPSKIEDLVFFISNNSTPLLLIADNGNENIIAQFISLGIDDFIVRDTNNNYLKFLNLVIYKTIRTKKAKTSKFYAEKAFKESKIQFKSLVENLQEGICTFDANEQFLFANRAADKIFGTSPGELINRSILEFVDEKTALLLKDQTRMRKKGEADRYEIEILRIDGEKRKIAATVSSQFDENGKLLQILGIFKDVTEQTEIIEQLSFQSAILDQIHDKITVTDLDGKITYVNHVVCETLGTSYDDLIGKTVHELGENPGKGATQQEIIDKTIANGNWRGEIANYTSNNREIIFDCRTILLRDNFNKPIGMIGISTDITDSKQTEQALRESEEKYKILAENQKDVVFTISSDGFLEYLSPAVKYFGYTPEEELGEHFTKYMQDPEEINRALQMLKDLYSDFKARSIELTYLAKDGTKIPVEITSTPIVENGKCVTINCILRDISERKKVEKALLESQDKLHKAQEVADIGSWDYDVQTQQPKWSKQLFKIFGIDPDQKEPSYSEHQKYIHPDDWDYFNETVVNAISNKTGYDIELRLVQSSGKVVWVNSKCEPKIKNDEIIGLIGTTQNITYRKKAEDELRQALTESKALYDAARAVFECKTFFDCSRKIFDACRDATGAVSGYIALFDKEKQENNVLFLEDGGLACSVDHNLPMPVRGLREIAYKEKRVVYKNNFMDSDWIDFIPNGHVVLQNVLFAPLIIDGVVLGVIAIANKPVDFNENDVKISKAFGDIAAIALDRSRTIEKLENREERYRAFINATEDMVYVKDMDFKYTLINQANVDFFGRNEDEIIGKTDFELIPEEIARVCRSSDEAAIQENRVIVSQEKFGDKIFETRKFPLGLDFQVGVGAFIRDITENIKQEKELAQLEEQFRQAQKMEAIGILAGGVAHDFNNILNVIMGYSELLMEKMHKDDPAYEKIASIRKNADRATILTRQLLAFSRKQILQPTVLNLNTVVNSMENMLRRLIGEDIEFITNLDPALSAIKADKGQIEQVLMNIVVNARDAMPDGGQLIIETQNIELDKDYIRKHTDGSVGHHVMLTISDTGVGMTKEVQDKCFEPFFTTKKSGKGTGLGISTAYGIVKQSGGSIWVYSELGKGTTFKIYFPIDISETSKDNENVRVSDPLIRKKTYSVLVVEDNEPMCEMIGEILRNADFRVFLTSNPLEAIEIYKEHQNEIDILLTDVVMPNMSGKKLVENLQLLDKDLKVLFMSGYTDDAIVHQGVLDEGTQFIQKPFRGKDLVRKIYQVFKE